MSFITLGHGAELGIGTDNKLFLVKRNERGMIISCIELGPATHKRFDELVSYIQQLKIHAVEEKVLL